MRTETATKHFPVFNGDFFWPAFAKSVWSGGLWKIEQIVHNGGM